MKMKIYYNLWWLKRRARPKRLFRKQLLARLRQEWQINYQVHYSWFWFVRYRLTIGTLIVAIIFSGIGTSVYAYSSPDVTPNSLLYPVKQNLENIGVLTKTTPAAKAKYYLKLLKRRDQEKNIMAGRKENLKSIEDRIEQTEQSLDKTNTELSEIKTTDQGLMQEIKDRLELRKQRLWQKENNLEQLEATTSTEKSTE